MEQQLVISDYSEAWPFQFEALKAVYEQLLGLLLSGIEHVGSTSVRGLAAKPILDIDLVIRDQKPLPEIIRILGTAGYIFRGDLGIRDRYAFGATTPLAPDIGTGQRWPAHHLYCCIGNSVSLANHLLLRNALRRDTALCAAYARLKRRLAVSVNGDIDLYVAGKSEFISRILSREGLSDDAISGIKEQNRKK